MAKANELSKLTEPLHEEAKPAGHHPDNRRCRRGRQPPLVGALPEVALDRLNEGADGREESSSRHADEGDLAHDLRFGERARVQAGKRRGRIRE